MCMYHIRYRNAPSSVMRGGQFAVDGGGVSRSQLAMRSRGLDERSSTESSSLPPLSTKSDPVFSPRKITTMPARHRRPVYVLTDFYITTII